MDQSSKRLAAVCARFAEREAHGRSALFEALAVGVAGDGEALTFLLSLPAEKRQPNLLLAAIRHVSGTARGWADFRQMLFANREAIRACMLDHAAQTNEPARCAVLLPVLARLRQPLALIEVGASAGSCLLPDFYGYDYIAAKAGAAPEGRFLLSVNGSPVAWTEPHGAAIDWIGEGDV